MLCLECGSCTRARRRQKYHYTESGLRNLWLRDITILVCPRCKTEYPEIPNIRRVHQWVADQVAQAPHPLIGEEFRFLRKQMRLSTIDLAEVMGVKRESISKWENNREPIGPQSDRLIRLIYMVWSRAEEQPPVGPPLVQWIRDTLTSIKKPRARRAAPIILVPPAEASVR